MAFFQPSSGEHTSTDAQSTQPSTRTDISSPLVRAGLDPLTTMVVATGNAHKVKEIEAILSEVLPDFSFVAIHDIVSYEDPQEDGASFFDNALIKARSAQKACKSIFTLADDSGLCVDALGGAPGILSARFAGVHGDDAQNNKKLLSMLSSTPTRERRAHFHCSMVLIKHNAHAGVDEVFRGEGNCFGFIATQPAGEAGFGYDPLFLPDDKKGRSMAELSSDEKNRISHRRCALEDLARKIS